MIGEMAGEGLLQRGDLAAQAGACQSARVRGSRCPAISAAIIARPDTPNMSLTTTDSLICASSSSFSARCFSAVRSAIRSTR